MTDSKPVDPLVTNQPTEVTSPDDSLISCFKKGLKLSALIIGPIIMLWFVAILSFFVYFKFSGVVGNLTPDPNEPTAWDLAGVLGGILGGGVIMICIFGVLGGILISISRARKRVPVSK